jgi:hypothetical protein
MHLPPQPTRTVRYAWTLFLCFCRPDFQKTQELTISSMKPVQDRLSRESREPAPTMALCIVLFTHFMAEPCCLTRLFFCRRFRITSSARLHSSAVRAIATRYGGTPLFACIERALSMKHLLSPLLQRLSSVLRSLRMRVIEAHQKRKLRRMLKRVGSIRHLEKGIRADRRTTERLLLAMGARRTGSDEWTLS